jgi:hypothetical protein
MKNMGVLTEQMKRLLKTWPDNKAQKHIAVSHAIISTKSKNLYDDLKRCIWESTTDET